MYECTAHCSPAAGECACRAHAANVFAAARVTKWRSFLQNYYGHLLLSVIIIIIIIRLHHITIARCGLCYRRNIAWTICAYVCLSVCRSRSWPLQKRLNRPRRRVGGWLRCAKEPCIRWGPDRKGKGQFLEVCCSVQWKACLYTLSNVAISSYLK